MWCHLGLDIKPKYYFDNEENVSIALLLKFVPNPASNVGSEL